MTTMPLPPLYRAWSNKEKRFIKGVLSTENKFLVFNEETKQLDAPIDDLFIIDLYTGKIAGDGKPVYQNDHVRYFLKNEFGSMAEYDGVVKYDPEVFGYYIERATENPQTMLVEDELIISAVLGHTHI